MRSSEIENACMVVRTPVARAAPDGLQGIAWDKIMGRRVGIERLKSMNSNDHHEIPSGNQ